MKRAPDYQDHPTTRHSPVQTHHHWPAGSCAGWANRHNAVDLGNGETKGPQLYSKDVHLVSDHIWLQYVEVICALWNIQIMNLKTTCFCQVMKCNFGIHPALVLEGDPVLPWIPAANWDLPSFWGLLKNWSYKILGPQNCFELSHFRQQNCFFGLPTRDWTETITGPSFSSKFRGPKGKRLATRSVDEDWKPVAMYIWLTTWPLLLKPGPVSGGFSTQFCCLWPKTCSISRGRCHQVTACFAQCPWLNRNNKSVDFRSQRVPPPPRRNSHSGPWGERSWKQWPGRSHGPSTWDLPDLFGNHQRFKHEKIWEEPVFSGTWYSWYTSYGCRLTPTC